MNSVVRPSQWSDAECKDALEVISEHPQEYRIERYRGKDYPDKCHLPDTEVLGE